jgi:hypothetical protein
LGGGEQIGRNRETTRREVKEYKNKKKKSFIEEFSKCQIKRRGITSINQKEMLRVVSERKINLHVISTDFPVRFVVARLLL